MMFIHEEDIDWKRTRVLEKNMHLNFTGVHMEFSIDKLWKYIIKIYFPERNLSLRKQQQQHTATIKTINSERSTVKLTMKHLCFLIHPSQVQNSSQFCLELKPAAFSIALSVISGLY